jgi:hypothetical protein
MSAANENRYSDAECFAVLERLFPHGVAGPDVQAALAPAGWEHSPLLAVRHPSLPQLYEETVRIHRNIESLWRKQAPRPEPTLEEFARSYRTSPIEPEREIRELVGMSLWDVFSDNHEVIDGAGRVVDLGSFRGTGGFIADFVNHELNSRRYDYIDFYLGTIWVSQRADLTAVYDMVFRRLKALGLDWHYHWDEERRKTIPTDTETPDVVTAYQDVYGRPPKRWTPSGLNTTPQSE